MTTSERDFEWMFETYEYDGKHVRLMITDECNSRCEHCFFSGYFERRRVITDELIEIVVNDIDSSYMLTLLGGEPLLYPEKCALAIRLARKKGIKTQIMSNGFWCDDATAAKVVEMRPDFVVLSVDEFHQKNIQLDSLKKIGKKLLPSKIRIYGQSCREFYDEETNFGLDFPVLGRKLQKTGSSVDLRVPIRHRGPGLYQCWRIGFLIEPDGRVSSSCDLNPLGCEFGFYPEISIPELSKKIYKPIFFVDEDVELTSFCDVCRETKVNCSDLKWKDGRLIEYFSRKYTKDTSKYYSAFVSGYEYSERKLFSKENLKGCRVFSAGYPKSEVKKESEAERKFLMKERNYDHDKIKIKS